MKFFDKKIKSAIITFLVYALVIIEIGTLSAFRFVKGSDLYPLGYSSTKLCDTIALFGKNIGYNYLVASIVIFLCLLGYAFYVGYKRNWTVLVVLELYAILPFIGISFSYNFLYGWLTSQWSPMMTLFGLQNPGHDVGQYIFLVLVVVLIVGFWIFGKTMRARYIATHEFDY